MKNILLLLLLLPQFLLANNLDKMIFGERVEGVVYFEYKDFEMSQIRGLDLDLLGINLDDNTAHILGYEGQIEALKKMGLNFVEKEKNYLKRIDREYKTPSEIEVILKKYATKYS